MGDFNDENFWYRPKRPAREVVAEQLARLATEPKEQPQQRGSLEITDEERATRLVRLDERFGELVQIKGAPYPISRSLARRLGYEVDRLPQAPGYTAGDDPEARPD